MEAILNRRSIRRYTNQSVSDEQIKTLLEAAMCAPSAGNEQPWHFVVIKDRQLLDQVPQYHPHASMLKEAPVAILVCGDTRLSKYDVDYWVQDCAAATENLLLAVQDQGLGAVWLGIYPRQERVESMRQLFNIPDQVMPFALVPVGYPAEMKGPEYRYREDRVHLNYW
ncbi:MAG: nitroreductase family protein [Syntrophomonadaceae bacterium]|jgi:nitroreductase